MPLACIPIIATAVLDAGVVASAFDAPLGADMLELNGTTLEGGVPF